MVTEQHVDLCVTQGCNLSAGWPTIYTSSLIRGGGAGVRVTGIGIL